MILTLFRRKPEVAPQPQRFGDYRDFSNRTVRLDPVTKEPVWPVKGVPS